MREILSSGEEVAGLQEEAEAREEGPLGFDKEMIDGGSLKFRDQLESGVKSLTRRRGDHTGTFSIGPAGSRLFENLPRRDRA